MSKLNVVVAVEGRSDVDIVERILAAADLSTKANISVIALEGKEKVAAWSRNATNTSEHIYLALVDADILSVSDSRELARRQLGNPTIDVFCAVPTIEAWLFADDVTAEKFARNENASLAIQRAPLPEMIPYPKQVAFNVFGHLTGGGRHAKYSFLGEINVGVAMARSPSLKAFLLGVADAIGVSIESPDTTLGTSIPRDIFSNLLRELPSTKVVWKTLDRGSISADELATAVVEGDPIGKQYITEVLRVARDIIAGRASPK